MQTKKEKHSDKEVEYGSKDYSDSTIIGDCEIYHPWFNKCCTILMKFPTKRK